METLPRMGPAWENTGFGFRQIFHFTHVDRFRFDLHIVEAEVEL